LISRQQVCRGSLQGDNGAWELREQRADTVLKRQMGGGVKRAEKGLLGVEKSEERDRRE
jgi:hypothetical protein